MRQQITRQKYFTLAAPNKHCLTVSFPFTGTPKQVPDLCSTNERFHHVTLGVISSQPPPSSLRPHPPTGTPPTVRDTPFPHPSRMLGCSCRDPLHLSCYFSATAVRIRAVLCSFARCMTPPTSSSLTGTGEHSLFPAPVRPSVEICRLDIGRCTLDVVR